MDLKLSVVIALVLVSLVDLCTPRRLDQKLSATVDYAGEQYTRVLADGPTGRGRYPHTAQPDSSVWDDTTDFGGWTAGFYPGVLWELYRSSRDETWSNAAQSAQEGLRRRENDTGTHDVGFVIMSSFGLGLNSGFGTDNLTDWQSVIVQAAHSLSTRFVEVAGVIRSWNSDGDDVVVIVDNMMNLDLMYTAEKISGNKTFGRIADIHAQSTIKNHFRPDGSSFHVVAYSELDGTVLRKYTAQGYLDNSTWARGQAWVILGYIESYEWTNNPEYLEIAEKAADFFIAHLPEDYIPFWDFDAGLLAGSSYQPRDTSAASIAAYGFLKIYQSTRNVMYLSVSESIVESLVDNFNSRAVQVPSLSTNGTVFRNQGNFDTAIIYGDFYLLKYIDLYNSLPA